MALPGRPFAYMDHLICLNFQILGPTPISTELMLAIFWEESFFNNVVQSGGGTAVGFGQTEPYEFWRFDAKGSSSQLAKQKGYLVHHLPQRVSIGRRKARLTAPLDDFTSVKVACAMVRDLFERGKRSKLSILQAYGGVGFTGQQPAHLAAPGGRMKIIQGWLDCETALKSVRQSGSPGQILSALKKAKSFNRDKEFEKRLFPQRVVLEHS